LLAAGKGEPSTASDSLKLDAKLAAEETTQRQSKRGAFGVASVVVPDAEAERFGGSVTWCVCA
jgi:hypothetical protein